MFKPYTLKDIAKALKISPSTVSRALSGKYEISAETKLRVLEYAKKVNYSPNPIALSLKNQKSHSIGVVVCEFANSFFSQAISGIESVAYKKGYHVIVTQTHESSELEEENVKHLLSRHVDGLLISMSAETTDTTPFKLLQENGVPLVFFDRVARDIDAHKITADNVKGAFEGVELLIKKGYKKIAYLTTSQNLLINTERLEGYRAAHAAYAIPVCEEYIKICSYYPAIKEDAEAAVGDLMRMDNPPEAIFTATDRLTTNCLFSLKNLGFNIPADVAIVGYTNSDVAELFDPPLTVVRQPAFRIGQRAAEILINTIESKRPIHGFTEEHLQNELIIRSSS